ncbi:MAG TPA: helix-turn-helix domain-containing protein [Xanthobacteraceae bacterium]|nr:helix-turn-helix domain-containing protein [Xanthobacteraceae bacterium]
MRWNDLRMEPCSVARTVSVIGDRWTILILRDCFLRVRRFEDFQARLGITRHVLADRLRKLVRLGVLKRALYQHKPPRYEYRLTPKGLDLQPVLLALVRWGDTHMGDERGRPVLLEHRDCGQVFDPVVVCSQCGGPVDAHNVRTRPGPGAPSALSAASAPADHAAHG